MFKHKYLKNQLRWKPEVLTDLYNKSESGFVFKHYLRFNCAKTQTLKGNIIKVQIYEKKKIILRQIIGVWAENDLKIWRFETD